MNPLTPRSFPALFVSHGSPMIALEPGETGEFLRQLGQTLDAHWGRPKAVLAVSAHTAARVPVLLGGARHEAVYDFGGFPPALYQLRYDAPGAPALAEELRQQYGFPLLDQGGLDHGIWTVLRYVYPNADVPVLPLALVPDATPEALIAFGEHLAALRSQGILVMATGSMTHNLRLLMSQRQQGVPSTANEVEMPESAAFRTWFEARGAARDWAALEDYRQQAPHAAFMHPTDEHLLPWYVAAGAGGRDHAAVRIHDAFTHGCMGMDAYAFGAEAAALQQALQQTVAEPA